MKLMGKVADMVKFWTQTPVLPNRTENLQKSSVRFAGVWTEICILDPANRSASHLAMVFSAPDFTVVSTFCGCCLGSTLCS